MSGQDEVFEIKGFEENRRLSERDVPTIPTMKSLEKKPSDSSGSDKKTASSAAKKRSISREEALELLKKYNKEPFHIQRALMRPSKSTMDMEVKSLKKKFKDKKFAAGCSKDVITQGAETLGWELDELIDKTILAMGSCEAAVAEAME